MLESALLVCVWDVWGAYTKSTGRRIVAGENERLDRRDKHLPGVLVQRCCTIARSILLAINRNGIVNGKIGHALALLVHGGRIADSLVHNASDVAV